MCDSLAADGFDPLHDFTARLDVQFCNDHAVVWQCRKGQRNGAPDTLPAASHHHDALLEGRSVRCGCLGLRDNVARCQDAPFPLGRARHVLSSIRSGFCKFVKRV